VKLAFTTLGCPDWDLDTIISNATEFGFDGVDFRGCRGEMTVYELPEFSSDVDTTVKRFQDAGLEVPCFSSSARLCCKTVEELDGAIQEVTRYAELCRQFGAPFIRVFGGGIGDTPRPQAIKEASDNFARMLAAVDDHGVRLLIETHDDWLEREHVKGVMEQVDSRSAGVLWDTHHPYRLKGETPAQTWETLGDWIAYTHWKDSYLEPESTHGHQLCHLGEGDIPLRDIFDCLRSGGYDGYLTLEWEKRWHPDLDEPEVAFPRYVRFMRELME